MPAGSHARRDRHRARRPDRRRTVELLKVDIERGEIELFGGPCPWLEFVLRNIVIELHDEECSEVFHRALSGYSYEEFTGEPTFCCDLRPRDAG